MKYRNKFVGWSVVAALLLAAAPVMAKPYVGRVNNKSGKVVTIPAHAIEVAENVYSLGTKIDPGTGKAVEGFMFIERRNNRAKGGNSGNKGKPSGGGDKCYAFLASGAKWKATEDYIVDPTNDDGLADSFVRAAIETSVDAWDSKASNFNVFGDEVVAGEVDGADTISPDNKNEVMFADIDSPGAVAVTIVWGIFGGRPSNRQLVEWDQVYDDVDYNFGNAEDAGFNSSNTMDFLNVAVHEVGHAAGMGHPSDGCTKETMYRYVSFGETLKRDLNLGDIAGINKLY